jgi:DNA-binding winged helix-turn-helix (wHTH) protein/predicted ATPase
MRAGAEKIYYFEGHTFDLRRGCLRRGDDDIEMRPKNFEVLRYLVENAGRLVSKDELIQAVWPTVVVTDESLMHCISELRRSLNDSDQRIIKTVPRRGYLLVAPVSLRAAGDTPKTLAAIAPAASHIHRAASSNSAMDDRRSGQSQPVERRQLTILSCEIVGLSELSTRLDPEDFSIVNAKAHRYCSEIIARYHGYVADYPSDGVLAYFGYPHAREHDAENGVRAALSVIASAELLGASGGVKLLPRIGIASGVVIVSAQTDTANERIAVGGPLNLADRLHAAAKPGSLVIAESTRRLVGEMFDYRDLGLLALDGLAKPSQVWQVLGESTVESRFEAHRDVRLSPLVGRDDELQLLRRRWPEVRRGEGHIALVSGEPGIGKSRLAVALQERLPRDAATVLRYFCSPHHSDSPLFPVTREIERDAGFARSDTPEQKLAKLNAMLRRTGGDRPDELPLIAALLSLQVEEEGSDAEMSAQKRRDRTLATLIDRFERLARQRPVLLIVEDVQWIDPTTRELLDMAVAKAPNQSLFLVITFRPEFQPPWIGEPHVTLLTLSRLAKRETETLVRHLACGEFFTDELTTEIAARADGIPLFIEELTKAVVESRYKRGDSTATKTGVPATLEASLNARLDRLSPFAREVAQTGAALGREFSSRLVAKLTGSDLMLADPLRELESAGLISARGVPPDIICTFKHALVREVAESMLVREQRKALHARIVEALEASWSSVVETEPERVAQHCASAGLFERAVMYWEKAARRAISRYALVEAITHLTRALGWLRELPASDENKRRELVLQIALGDTFIAAKGHGANDTGIAFDRACHLGREVADAAQLFRALAGVFVHHHVRAEVDRAQGAARELLLLAEAQKDIAGQVMAHRALGDSLLHVGHFTTARMHLERAVSLFGANASPVILGEDIGVATFAFLALCMAMLGFPAEATARSDAALERARVRVRHPHTLAFTLSVDCRLQWILRNPRRLQNHANELSVLAAEHGLKYMQMRGTADRGCALALAGHFDAALPLLNEGGAGFQTARAVWLLPFNRAMLAIAYQGMGHLDDARAALAEAAELERRSKVEWMKAEIKRLEANLELSRPAPDRELAEAKLRGAIAAARQQQARWWHLRAAVSLARLLHEQHRTDEARALLAPIYGWFVDGFETPDLTEAKAVLAELH